MCVRVRWGKKRYGRTIKAFLGVGYHILYVLSIYIFPNILVTTLIPELYQEMSALFHFSPPLTNVSYSRESFHYFHITNNLSIKTLLCALLPGNNLVTQRPNTIDHLIFKKKYSPHFLCCLLHLHSPTQPWCNSSLPEINFVILRFPPQIYVEIGDKVQALICHLKPHRPTYQPTNQPTNRPTDGPTKRVVESRSTRLKKDTLKKSYSETC